MAKPFNIGFIGLGQMGFPMAGLLVKGGHHLIVTDASAVRVTEFLHTYPGSAAQTAGWSAVDMLITMLPNSDIVESVLLKDGVAAQLKPGALIIDMSSSEPMRSRNLARQLAERGLKFIDAPVSGGVSRAIQGTLAIMVGGDADQLERAHPVLNLLGNKIFHVGSAGMGHAAKALNNYVSAAGLVAAVEALHVGEKFGIDPAMLTDVFNASSGRSNTTENKVKQFMLSGTYGSGFALKLMTKDIRIAMNLADELQQPVTLGKLCLKMWDEAATRSDNLTDHTAMYKLLD